jgi:aryl-alcohol dehydrogenase-like predicted oxidoreductase
MTKLGLSDLDVFPLCLGGNVFGWTADKDDSFAVLDAYAAAGGNFIDTADVYSAFVPGNVGGESETIIGEWLRRRGSAEGIVIATKVSQQEPFKGLSAASIQGGVEASLKRLGVDTIDLYWAHADDEQVPVEETVAAFDGLVKAGKVRHVAASNMSPERLAASLEFATTEGLARYVALQPHYNLMERADFERNRAPLAERWQLATVPYFALAMGFLTGKYRAGATVDSPRAQGAQAYQGERGDAVLTVLEQVAGAHSTTMAAVSLAWLLAQPTVVAPIASARNTGQLADLLPMAELSLSDDELAALTKASAGE